MNVQNSYTWNAQDYARHSAGQLKWAQELVAKLDLKSGESVLDIGCGDGKVTAEIATLVGEGVVVGIDNSKAMINLACQSFPKSQHPNLDFHVANARSIPYHDQFDVIFSNAALHWLKDHRPVLAGISRALKPGGRILLQMGGYGNATGILEVLDELLPGDPWNAYFENFEFPYGFHKAEPYKQWLHAAGLQPVRVELIPKTMIHENRDKLVGWIRTTWLPYTQRIPETLQDTFIDAVVDRYLEKQPPDDDGCIPLAMVRLEVEANKM